MVTEKDINAVLAKNIVAARKRRGWTQKELAARSGVKFRSLQNYENARCGMNVYSLYRISAALCVPPAALMGLPGSWTAGVKQNQAGGKAH